jgi:hypothetical protein
MAYVLKRADVELDYGQVPVEPKFELGSKSLPSDMKWAVAIHFPHVAVYYEEGGSVDRLMDRFDTFLMERKNWKRFSQDYVYNLVEELGGRVV